MIRYDCISFARPVLGGSLPSTRLVSTPEDSNHVVCSIVILMTRICILRAHTGALISSICPVLPRAPPEYINRASKGVL